LMTALLWFFLLILGTFSAVGFGYIYHKDKRKLMFSFAFASISYLPKTQLGGENTEINIESSELPKIKTCKDLKKRIFVNLAVNGIHAMKEKGGIVKILTKKSNGWVEASFKDTGTGTKKNI